MAGNYNDRPHGTMPGWLVKWLINALALLIVSYVPYGRSQLIHIDGAGAALVAAMVLGIVNTFIRPIFMLFSLPMQFATFGLFTLVINALMLMLGDWLMGRSFDLPGGLFAAIIASILLGLTGAALNAIIRGDK